MGNIEREEALVSVGPGWATLINRLYDAKPEGIGVVQVKEKFGGLRIYIDKVDETFGILLDLAENESLTICEQCGERGWPAGKGWIKTLCNKHHVERQGHNG